MNVGDVVQFNENHKWCGSLGIITEKREFHNDKLQCDGNNDFRYMVAVPSPMQGSAYIFVCQSEFAIERIGEARLVIESGEEE